MGQTLPGWERQYLEPLDGLKWQLVLPLEPEYYFRRRSLQPEVWQME